LLPYLDSATIYELINNSARVGWPYIDSKATIAVQTTAAARRVSVFVCPSDGATGLWSAPINYRGNWGVGPFWERSREFPDSGNGLFCGVLRVSLRIDDIADGLAATAMFSERLVGNQTVNDFENRSLIPYTADDALAQCETIAAFPRDPDSTSMAAGSEWLYTGLENTLYSHAAPPNSTLRDCIRTDYAPAIGFSSARSSHPSLVFMCFADGHVASVSDRVALEVWRALATRNGGEFVSLSTL
jgi:prepilin-type processing-associated H-X9-DG protein